MTSWLDKTSRLKKVNVEKLFKKNIVKSDSITIEKNYEARCGIISELTTLLTSDYHDFSCVNTHHLEGKIASYKESFKNMDTKSYHYYRYGAKTEEEYVKNRLYSENRVDTFILKKYKSTQKISEEVLLFDLYLSDAAQSRVMFAIFFNNFSQLCFDFIVKKGRDDYRIKSLENDIKILSTTTSVDAVKFFFPSLIEEDKKIKEEDKIRQQLNEKKRFKRDKVKALSIKAVILKIESFLDEKGLSYYIEERIYAIHISLKMRKGYTVIKVPKKDIQTRFDILPSLCDKILEADELNIQCRYHQ